MARNYSKPAAAAQRHARKNAGLRRAPIAQPAP